MSARALVRFEALRLRTQQVRLSEVPLRVVLSAALGVVMLIVATVLLLSNFADLTVTVDARTETVAWDVEKSADGRPYVLVLPPGDCHYYQLRRLEDRVEDELHGVSIDEPVSLVIAGSARIEIERSSVGEIRVTVRESDVGEADGSLGVSVFGSSAQLAECHDTLTYVSRCHRASKGPCAGVDFAFRALIRAERLIVGGHPLERVPPQADAVAAFAEAPPPSLALREGRLRAFNQAVGYGTRYQLSEEVLDLGDVVVLEASEPDGPGEPLVWGAVSATFDTSGGLSDALHVVAHAKRERVEVSRFGGGYRFGATTWDALASQPVFQAFWIALASFVLLLNGFSSLRGLIRSRSEEQASARGDDERAMAETYLRSELTQEYVDDSPVDERLEDGRVK
ncbi:MAG: hypothetical protein AAF533_19510 [Acidobacteriota bacterium]